MILRQAGRTRNRAVPMAGIVSGSYETMTLILIEREYLARVLGDEDCLYSVFVSSTYEDLRARVGWRLGASVRSTEEVALTKDKVLVARDCTATSVTAR
jgi:hypothetical protein